MFGIFKKKSKLEVLQKKYEQLLKKSHQLSKINRSASDKKIVEAELVLKEMDLLRKNT